MKIKNISFKFSGHFISSEDDKKMTVFDMQFYFTKTMFSAAWETMAENEKAGIIDVVMEKKSTLKSEKYIKNAEEILRAFNATSGLRMRAKRKNKRPTAALMKIISILRLGYTVENCMAVINFKWDPTSWFVNGGYYRVDTLFGKSKFEKYLAEAKHEQSANEKKIG